VYPASNLRVRDGFLWTPGVLSPSSLLVALTTGFGVSVQPGAAYVQQTVQAEGNSFYDGLYFVIEDNVDSPYNSIAAPVSSPRLDQVILRVYDVTEQGLSGSSFGRIEWLEGSENSGATYPNIVGATALPANSLLLAYAWSTVGASSIAHLQDARVFSSLQGFRRTAVRAYLGTAQTIVDGPLVTLPINTVSYDVGSNFNITTYQYTVPETGFYQIFAGTYVENVVYYDQIAGLYVVQNGNTRITGAVVASIAGSISVADILPCTQGDLLSLSAGFVNDPGGDPETLYYASPSGGTYITIIRVA
jgi:hypothetical protein